MRCEANVRTLHSTFRSKLGDLLGSTGWNIFRDGHLGGPQSEAPVGPRTRNWTWRNGLESLRDIKIWAVQCVLLHTLQLGEQGLWLKRQSLETEEREKKEWMQKHPRPVTNGELLEGGCRKGWDIVSFLSISWWYIVWYSCQAAQNLKVYSSWEVFRWPGLRLWGEFQATSLLLSLSLSTFKPGAECFGSASLSWPAPLGSLWAGALATVSRYIKFSSLPTGNLWYVLRLEADQRRKLVWTIEKMWYMYTAEFFQP